MSYNFPGLYNALRTQIKAATALPDAQVFWEGSGVNRPATASYVTLSVLHTEPLNQIPETQVVDNPASTLGDGEEILLQFFEWFEVVIEIQCISVVKDGQFPQGPILAENIRNYFATDTSNAAFLAVGATIVTRSTVRHLPTVLNTMLESRASLEVRLRYGSVTQRTETFIETVETPDFDFDD